MEVLTKKPIVPSDDEVRAQPARAQRQAARGGTARVTGRDPQDNGMEAFEYAIKKDVRNNPIVREVDEARQRELWQSVGVGGFLVLVLLFSAWQHFELLRHGYRSSRCSGERAAEEEIGRHLRLEIETLRVAAAHRDARDRAAAAGRARRRDEAIVIERVLPAEPPAASVVARR